MADDPKKKEVPTLRLYLKEITIPIEATPGNVKKYILRECWGGDRQQWQNRQVERALMDNLGRPVGTKNYVGMEADLVALCLFDEEQKPVPKETIQGWPSSTQIYLYEKAMEMNAFTKIGEEEAKKS